MCGPGPEKSPPESTVMGHAGSVGYPHCVADAPCSYEVHVEDYGRKGVLTPTSLTQLRKQHSPHPEPGGDGAAETPGKPEGSDSSSVTSNSLQKQSILTTLSGTSWVSDPHSNPFHL